METILCEKTFLSGVNTSTTTATSGRFCPPVSGIVICWGITTDHITHHLPASLSFYPSFISLVFPSPPKLLQFISRIICNLNTGRSESSLFQIEFWINCWMSTAVKLNVMSKSEIKIYYWRKSKWIMSSLKSVKIWDILIIYLSDWLLADS